MKKMQWIYSIILSFMISSFMAFIIVYKTDIKEWYIMYIISFIIGTLLIKVVMFCVEEGNSE